MSEFFAYARGLTDQLPAGHSANGMRLYRHLVMLGARQMLEAHFPQLPEQLGGDQWDTLLAAFVRGSQWNSPFYGDIVNDFIAFLEREAR
jgi:hypothetical protein